MAYVVIGNNRGPRGLQGKPGDPLSAAGAKQLVDLYDFLKGDDPRAPIRGGRAIDEDVLHVGTDLNFRETWEGSRTSDGGPTELGVWHLQNRLGVHLHDDPGIMAGFVDASFRYTDLVVDNRGRVPDWVMDRWAPRIADRIGGGGGGSRGLSPSDRYLSGGKLVPVFPDTKQITMWGSSSAERIGSALGAALSGTGADFHNEGKGAETVQHISARLGSIPALLTVVGGSIPASGTVVVTASNMTTNLNIKPYAGTLNGVAGIVSSTATEMTFQRSTAGAVTAVTAGTPFIPTVGTASRQHVTMLWMGKNNLSGAGNAPTVISQTDTAFDYLSPIIKRVLVLGHFVDTGETVGSIQYNNVNQANAAHKARYGDFFLDVSAYLCSPQLWIDTGITPTAEDLRQQADGIKPSSIAHDAGHMNAAGYAAVSNLIYNHLAFLGWY